MRWFLQIGFLLLLPTTTAAQLRSEVYVSGLSLPVAFVQDPTNSTVQYVVQQSGRIRVIRDGTLQSTDFLNLSGSIAAGGERGLLGMAFAPDYATSGRFYVNFTNTSGNTVVVRFRRSSTDPSVADPASRFDLRWGGPAGLRFIVQPFSNHNGGHDVGQSAWEEVSYEPPNRGRRNYGWRNREGAHNNVTSLPAAYLPLVDPIHEYESNGAAVTGGFVYRGTRLGGAYRGRYLFGEYVERRVWSIALSIDPATGEATASDLREHTAELGGGATLGNISSFGIDAAGELYVTNYSAGRVLRILPVATPTSATPGTLDFDGDGRGDSFRYSASSGAWSIDYSNGSGDFISRAGTWSAGWRVQGDDFDADGYTDLFLYNPSNGQWFQCVSDGWAGSPTRAKRGPRAGICTSPPSTRIG